MVERIGIGKGNKDGIAKEPLADETVQGRLVNCLCNDKILLILLPSERCLSAIQEYESRRIDSREKLAAKIGSRESRLGELDALVENPDCMLAGREKIPVLLGDEASVTVSADTLGIRT